jgi:hypothetical protein
VEAADAAQLDQVLEVPAYDGVGAGHGGECHVQGVDAGGGGDARAARLASVSAAAAGMPGGGERPSPQPFEARS